MAADIEGALEQNRGYKELTADVSEGMTNDISLYLAQEGHTTSKQLSGEHQNEFLAARQKMRTAGCQRER